MYMWNGFLYFNVLYVFLFRVFVSFINSWIWFVEILI